MYNCPTKKVCFWVNFASLSRTFLVSVFLTPFNGLFDPTFHSPVFKLFRFSESLKKSYGNKWSQIWQLLIVKGVKSPRQKKVCLWIFFIYLLCWNVFLHPCPKVQCPNFFLYFRTPRAKSNGKKWSQIWKLLLIKGVKSQQKRRKKSSAIFCY